MTDNSVFNVTQVAAATFERLKTNRTDRGLEDLGHGSVELLREVTLRVKVKEHFWQGQAALQALCAVLLLLKCHLLQWDSQTFAQHDQFVLPDMAHDFSVLSFRHTHKETFLSEVQSCLKFMAANEFVFQQEPWMWLQQCLQDLLTKYLREKKGRADNVRD